MTVASDLGMTAALATGARTTPTRPLRPGVMGKSGSCVLEGLVRLGSSEDGLRRDAAIRAIHPFP